MTGSILRLINVAVLLAVTAISAGPALCLLPCAPVESAATDDGGHCEHSAAQTDSSLTGFASGCDDCDQLRLDVADRVASRSSVELMDTASFAAIEYFWQHSVRSNPHAATGPAPGLHTPLDTHRPLRI